MSPNAEEEEAGEERPRLFGPAYWTAIAFAVLCIAGGLAVAHFGPRWFAPATETLGERPDSR